MFALSTYPLVDIQRQDARSSGGISLGGRSTYAHRPRLGRLVPAIKTEIEKTFYINKSAYPYIVHLTCPENLRLGTRLASVQTRRERRVWGVERTPDSGQRVRPDGDGGHGVRGRRWRGRSG